MSFTADRNVPALSAKTRTITIENTGDREATYELVADGPPARYQSLPANATEKVTKVVGTIDEGQSHTIEYRGRLTHLESKTLAAQDLKVSGDEAGRVQRSGIQFELAPPTETPADDGDPSSTAPRPRSAGLLPGLANMSTTMKAVAGVSGLAGLALIGAEIASG